MNGKEPHAGNMVQSLSAGHMSSTLVHWLLVRTSSERNSTHMTRFRAVRGPCVFRLRIIFHFLVVFVTRAPEATEQRIATKVEARAGAAVAVHEVDAVESSSASRQAGIRQHSGWTVSKALCCTQGIDDRLSRSERHVWSDSAQDSIVTLPCLSQYVLHVINPFIGHDHVQHRPREEIGRMSFGEFNHLLGDESQMAHVSQPHVHPGLSIIAFPLTLHDLLGDSAAVKQIDGEVAIETPVHGTIEDLLDNVIDNIV